MYKIKDFSIISNTSIVTLRYYDEIDLFKPKYVDYYSGYRYYENSQLKEINKINKLKSFGLTLDEIKNYIFTNNIDILINKMKGYEDKMKEIKEFINEKEINKYTIIKGNYAKYLELRGLLNGRCAIALEIKDNNADYYYIEENDIIIDDFAIYKEDNWITIDEKYIKNNELVKIIFDYLKKDYNYITLKVPIENKDYIDYIENSFNTKKTINNQGKYEYYTISIEI